MVHIHAHDRYDRAARGAGMLFVPSVFAWPDVYVAARPPWRPTLAYPARGAADLWSSREAPRNASLAALVGARRASVLTRLDTPHTTLELAHALGLSPGAASTQVTTLWRAGIADRTRVGRRVFYVLNGRGQAFKGALDRIPRSPDATGIGGRFASKPQRAKQRAKGGLPLAEPTLVLTLFCRPSIADTQSFRR
jgi:DNA-binding MarR family transcriptional regulator